MSLLITLVGVALVVVAVRDVYQQLFRPSVGSVLSLWLMRAVWKGFRMVGRWRPVALELAGAAVLLSVIGTWASLVAVGSALIYWPHLPDQFLISTGLAPSENGGFLDALYLSLVTLTTLGYGDITPTSAWLRLIAPLEALIGFGLFTAVISWLLSIYPVISRRRTLAREITLLERGEREAGVAVESLGTQQAVRTLEELASEVTAVEGDLTQFPITYYFHNSEKRNSLPVALPYLLCPAERVGGEGSAPEVRLRAAMLRGAIEDFSNRVASKAFLGLPSASTWEALEAYAEDHLQGSDKASGHDGQRRSS